MISRPWRIMLKNCSNMICCNSYEEALSCSTQSHTLLRKMCRFRPLHHAKGGSISAIISLYIALRGFFTVKTRTLKQFTSNSSVHWKISCASKVNRSIFKTNAHKMFYYACTMLNAFGFYYAQNNASRICQGLLTRLQFETGRLIADFFISRPLLEVDVNSEGACNRVNTVCNGQHLR